MEKGLFKTHKAWFKAKKLALPLDDHDYGQILTLIKLIITYAIEKQFFL